MTQTRRSGRRNEVVSQTSVVGTTRGRDLDSSSGSASPPFDYTKMTAGEIMNVILERNKDPVIESLIHAYISKIPQELAENVESEKRARSLVVYGLPEPADDLSPSISIDQAARLGRKERMHEKELREECKERNKQAKDRVWVVYRGELRRVQDLPQRGLPGNA
ncbi:hypothetical protein Y032_0225g2752 [Ancylostoma ceylanicum]|uniref:Uncharacterized protein n=1 Tax=Ancylostoma ceylanicum TaxID=53326 RepID=A0A016SH63_9BILA|nr:hypothetical protein Y032_0225g2752 [Ancylostoma ceylanicum]